jgi:thioredoxin 1
VRALPHDCPGRGPAGGNGKVKVAKLNVDEYPAIPSQYSIMSIPTLLLFKNGQVVSRLVGYQTKDKLAQALEKNL